MLVFTSGTQFVLVRVSLLHEAERLGVVQLVDLADVSDQRVAAVEEAAAPELGAAVHFTLDLRRLGGTVVGDLALLKVAVVVVPPQVQQAGEANFQHWA